MNHLLPVFMKLKGKPCLVVGGGKIALQKINQLLNCKAKIIVIAPEINECIKSLDMNIACAPTLNMDSSVILYDGNRTSYINRDNIKFVQTPQCFHASLLRKIHNSKITGTDEIGVLLRISPETEIDFILGSEKNKKITTEHDLIYAKTILLNSKL